MSSWPARSSIRGIIWLTLSGLVRSIVNGIASGPRIAQADFKASSSRSTSTTRAPSRSRILEHSRPIPEAAPVMAATFPDSVRVMAFPLLGVISGPAMRHARAAGQRVDDDGDGQHGAGEHVPVRR